MNVNRSAEITNPMSTALVHNSQNPVPRNEVLVATSTVAVSPTTTQRRGSVHPLFSSTSSGGHLEQAQHVHGVGHAGKTGDVAAGDQIAGHAVLLGGVGAGAVDTAHDVAQALLGKFERP